MIESIKKIRKKDKEAVAVLYNRYGKKLYGFAIHKWHVTEDEAWELIYKTLYKILEVIDRYTFESDSKFNGFIYQVFINNLKNHYNEKKGKRLETVDLGEKLESRVAEKKDVIDTAQLKNPYMICLKQILERFEDWKRILMLMKAQNFSYEEIASYVNKPANQLKVYYMRSKQVLIQKVNDCVGNSIK